MKRIDELENINRRLLSENEVLRRQLLDDQQDRVKFVMEIAKRGNVYSIFFYLQAIINFRTGVRFNRPSLRLAARRMFAPIWSARFTD